MCDPCVKVFQVVSYRELDRVLGHEYVDLCSIFSSIYGRAFHMVRHHALSHVGDLNSLKMSVNYTDSLEELIQSELEKLEQQPTDQPAKEADDTTVSEAGGEAAAPPESPFSF